jgi:hypothetical protein
VDLGECEEGVAARVAGALHCGHMHMGHCGGEHVWHHHGRVVTHVHVGHMTGSHMGGMGGMHGGMGFQDMALGPVTAVVLVLVLVLRHVVCVDAVRVCMHVWHMWRVCMHVHLGHVRVPGAEHTEIL